MVRRGKRRRGEERVRRRGEEREGKDRARRQGRGTRPDQRKSLSDFIESY
jgi:hypothetical protein